MFVDRQRLAAQDLFESSSGGTPDLLAALKHFQRSPQRGTQHGFGRTKRAMKIDLAEHVVTRLEIFFDSVHAPQSWLALPPCAGVVAPLPSSVP